MLRFEKLQTLRVKTRRKGNGRSASRAKKKAARRITIEVEKIIALHFRFTLSELRSLVLDLAIHRIEGLSLLYLLPRARFTHFSRPRTS